VLWRLVDWSALVIVVTSLARASGGNLAAQIAMPVATAGYGVLVWRILAATPRAIRGQIRRHLIEFYPIVALVGIAMLLLCAYTLAFQDGGSALAAPGVVFLLIVVFRLRNRIVRGIIFGIRRLYFRAGRRPRR
jgi:hypothetical protein